MQFDSSVEKWEHSRSSCLNRPHNFKWIANFLCWLSHKMREETKGDKEFNLLSVHIYTRVKKYPEQYIHIPLSMGINSRGGASSTRIVFDDVLRTKRKTKENRLSRTVKVKTSLSACERVRVVIFRMYTIKRNIYTRLTDGIHPLHHVEIEITKEYHHSKVKSSPPLCVTVINDKKMEGKKQKLTMALKV